MIWPFPRVRASAPALTWAVLLGAAVAPPRTAIAQRTGPFRGWEATVGAEQGWESNVRFQRAGDPGDFVSRVGTGATARLAGGRARLALAARGDLARYRALESLDRSTYGFGADGGYRLTPRLSTEVAVSAATSLSSDLAQSGGATQPLLPLVLSRTQSANVGVTYLLSPAATGTATVVRTRVGFDSPLFAGGVTTGGTVAVARRYSPNAVHGAAYDVQDIRIGGQGAQLVQTLAATWHPMLAATAVRVRAGLSAVGAQGDAATSVLPSGGVAARRPALGGSMNVEYGRSASPVFGVGGVFTTDRVLLGYDREPARRLLVRTSVDRAWSRATGGGASTLSSFGVEAEVQRRFVSGTSVGVGAFARSRAQGGSVSNRGMRLGVTYSRAGR